MSRSEIQNCDTMSNIVYVLKGHEIIQPKLRVLTELTDRNEYNINDSQSDIVEELIHVETNAIIINEGACKSGQPDQKLMNGQNQNENMTQRCRLNLVFIV